MMHDLGGAKKDSAMFLVNDAVPLLRNPIPETRSHLVQIPDLRIRLCEKIVQENR